VADDTSLLHVWVTCSILLPSQAFKHCLFRGHGKKSHWLWGWQSTRFPPLACCIVCQCSVAYINQPKVIVANEYYLSCAWHCQHWVSKITRHVGSILKGELWKIERDVKGLIPLQFFLCLQYTNFIASFVVDPRFTPQGGVCEFCGIVVFSE